MAVTIKDVARAANTSVSTVSKVMNHSYDISEATAERVRAVIEELQYRPNVRAQNFARGSSRMILFLTELAPNIGFYNPHMFEIIAGVERALGEKGYKLILHSVTPEQACEYVERAAAEQSADGAVIHAAVATKKLDSIISKINFPHMVIGVPDFESHLCWIDSNNRLAGEMAARHLLELGYQRIAFIGGAEEDKITQHRMHGLFAVMNEMDMTADKRYIRHGNSTCESGYELAKELLNLKRRPDAIICADNYIAFGCVRAFQEEGLTIPEEGAIITFDDFPFSKVLSPKLSVVNIDVYDIGLHAGKLILSKIKKPNLNVQSYTTLPSLIQRESTMTHNKQ